MSRNLITGGTGLVGIYLARQLLADGEEVVLFQRRAELPRGAADLAERVEIASSDVGEWVHAFSKRFDDTGWTASTTAPPSSAPPARRAPPAGSARTWWGR